MAGFYSAVDTWNTWRRELANKDVRVAFAGIDFSEAPKDQIDFSAFEFGDGADFSGCRWPGINREESFDAFLPGRASFNCAAFGDMANFTGAAFGETASFTHAAFDHEVSFRGVAFGYQARFDNAAFGDEASFGGAAFGYRARFDNAVFGGGAFGHGVAFAPSMRICPEMALLGRTACHQQSPLSV
jgi:hypothetical protein